MTVEPNAEDWAKAHALKHLEDLDASGLRTAYRELCAFNFMYLRILDGIKKAASCERSEVPDAR